MGVIQDISGNQCRECREQEKEQLKDQKNKIKKQIKEEQKKCAEIAKELNTLKNKELEYFQQLNRLGYERQIKTRDIVNNLKNESNTKISNEQARINFLEGERRQNGERMKKLQNQLKSNKQKLKPFENRENQIIVIMNQKASLQEQLKNVLQIRQKEKLEFEARIKEQKQMINLQKNKQSEAGKRMNTQLQDLKNKQREQCEQLNSLRSEMQSNNGDCANLQNESNTRRRNEQINRRDQLQDQLFQTKKMIFQIQKQQEKKLLETNKNIVPAKDNDLGERNNYFKYFQGDVLDQADDYRDFLVTILQNKIHKTIQKTKLVYKYDPHSQESIHKYIDNIENIVLLVKTTNGYIFGGWTESAFIPKTSQTKSGLLFSVTNRACFELVTPNTKAIVHDPSFVIFGNNQIRLKNGDIKVTSNFGKINGFYKSKGERANILLGNGSLNEADIETFEFFSLTFRN